MIEAILQRLDKVTSKGDGYLARCPHHEDNSPSLTITERDGKVLLHCFAGCTAEEVMHSINLEMRDLFSDSLSPRDKAQYKLNQLENDLTRMQAIVHIYQQDAVKKGFGSIDKQGYALAIEDKNSLVVEINTIKGRYSL